MRRKFSLHGDIRKYNVRELVLAGFLKLVPLRTHKMVADALTKSLLSPAFVGHRQIMTGHASFAACLLHCVRSADFERFVFCNFFLLDCSYFSSPPGLCPGILSCVLFVFPASLSIFSPSCLHNSFFFWFAQYCLSKTPPLCVNEYSKTEFGNKNSTGVLCHVAKVGKGSKPHLCHSILTDPFVKPHLCYIDMAKDMAKVIALLSLCQACANPTVKTPFDPGCRGERGSIPGAFSSHDFRLHNLVWSSLLKILKTLQFSYFRICGKIELMLCRGLRSQPIILRIPHGKAFSRRTWTSIWARGKRRGFSPGAVARHRSRTRDSLIMSFSSVLFWSGFLFPLLFSLFAEIAPPIFFPMKLDKDSGCISVIFGPSATAFRFKNRKKTQFFEIGLLLKKLNLLRSDNYRLGPISDFSGKNAQETSDYKKSQKTYQKSELKIRRDSGPTRAVAKGLKPLRLPRAPT